jgi:hypothetical protein
MLQRLLSFRARNQPYMVRLSYTYELRSAFTYPLAASLADGSFTGVVAAKYFNAPPVLIAVITAAPMFGNIMAMVWSELAKDRRKVPFVNLLQAGVVLSIAAVPLTYFMAPEAGAWVFAGMIIFARLMASGIVTLRSVIWRMNYPRQSRGQIIARITVAATAVLALTTFAGSAWLDRNPNAYIYLYPLAAMLGAIGIWQFSNIRVRTEGQMLRRRRQSLYTPRPESLAQTDEANVMNYQPQGRVGLRGFFADALHVLRTDREFRAYQRWQFTSGFSFMMFAPALLYMVSTEMTDRRTEYLLAIVVLQLIPLLTSLISTQLWAPLFDRVHITVFRVFQTSVSVAAQATLFAGAMYGLYYSDRNALWIIAAAQVLIGISNGGGNLAWNLGHNDFATAEKSATYMGVHVMLTGVRGCLAPFIGAWLYQAPWMGRWVFGLSVAICMVSLAGFARMASRAPRRMPEGRVRRMTEATGGAPKRTHAKAAARTEAG